MITENTQKLVTIKISNIKYQIHRLFDNVDIFCLPQGRHTQLNLHSSLMRQKSGMIAQLSRTLIMYDFIDNINNRFQYCHLCVFICGGVSAYSENTACILVLPRLF